MLSSLRRVLPVLLALVLFALFIWFAGPYFAFAEYRPLETVAARWIAIAVLFAGYGVWVAVKRLRAARASDKLVAAVVQQASVAERPSADVLQLRERFEEAAALLKARKRSGHTLYDLPWYVIIGAPGAGKTTALVNSGLHFPLEQRTGRNALRGIGGTRNCDWWFTDEAVLLDTAGRYTTQDSDASADSGAWREFLALLRKYRGRRPINGVILAISAQDLMAYAAGGSDPHAEAARRRLNELNRELRVQLPVYVMVTKCDLVAGFTEYFEDLSQEERAQVWGVTFPIEQTRSGQAAAALAGEFDALIHRLNERVFARVEQARDVQRRRRIFGFPQQMAALREQLTHFVADVFSSTRFEQQVLLRGVYFTSGTQEGTPIDRLLGTMGRRMGAPDVAAPPPGRGKSYFIERLLKEVLFAESGLAGVNRRFELRMAAAQIGAYAAIAVVTVLAVVLWSVSYARNVKYVSAVAADVDELAALPPAPVGSLDAALPRLDRIRSVVQSADRFSSGVPWSMRWGLYQGSGLVRSAREAYARELRGALLAQVAARFRQRLIDYAPEPERLYPYLKGYLMLGHPDHLDKKQLEYLADLEWQAAYANDPDRATSVSDHFKSLLEYNDSLRAVPLDEQIVAQARNTLKQASPAGLVYRYIRIGYANDTARALRLDVAAGLNADRVLRRKGRPLSEPIPSLYTKPVFQELTTKGTDEIVKQFTEEYWVWGDSRPAIGASSQLTKQLLDLYEQDYISVWDGILADIQAAPLGSLEDTKQALAILAGPGSPLRGLLTIVDEHTYLVAPEEPPTPGITGRIGVQLEGILGAGRERLGIETATPGAQITAHFEPIHRLVTAPAGGTPPIDGVMQKLQQLQQKLEPVGNQVGATNPGDPSAIASIGQSANELKRDAAPLPPGIAGVLTQVANGATAAVRGGVRSTVESRYQQEVVRACEEAVTSHYPFYSGSTQPITIEDFGRLFGYNGVFDTFFKNELATLVDVSRAPWTWRTDATGAAVVGSRTMLDRFERAERIRELFFRQGSMEPEVRFQVSTTYLDVNTARFVLDLHGQPIEYRHGPVIPKAVAWPGPKPGASIAFEERTGGRPNRAEDGPWAWFRLLDRAQMRRESDTVYTATFSEGGREARVRIEASTIRNPFGQLALLQQFRCS